MKNIFENAYFGKAYKTRDGKKAIYHGSKKHESKDGKVWTYHYLMIEPITINLLDEDMVINYYGAYINDNGIGRFANLKYCKDSGASAEHDIISEWQEEINEEELDGIAWCKAREEYIDDYREPYFEGFKAGYKQALSI